MHRSRKFDPMNEVVPRLTPSEVRALMPELPQPNSVWSIGKALFEVYRVKDLFDPRWPNMALYDLLVHARGSYYVYGDRPPLDEYDEKSAPHLVRVQYPFEDSSRTGTHMVEEWLSDRLVPCCGEPLGGGELTYFTYQEKHMDHWLQTKFFGAGEHYLFYTFASNRMCTISPYPQDKVAEESGIELPTRQAYTALCYILMRYHFLQDYLEPLGAQYKTSILNNRVVERSMTISAGGQTLSVEFTPAYKFFGLESPQLIQVDRKGHGGAPYAFPGYFLNIGQVVSLIRELIVGGILSKETLDYYLQDPALVQEFLGTEPIHFEKLRHIGKLLSAKGQIFGSALTGEELREIADREVSDGPELKISHVKTLRENCDHMLAALGATRQK